jgi:integrase
MAGRRGHGEGTVALRKDGRWVAAVDLGFDGNGRRQRKWLYAKTQAEAIRKLHAAQRQVDAGLPTPDERVTVKELLDRWFADVLRHQVAPVAVDNYRAVAQHHIVPALGRKRLSKLTAADVDALMSRKLDDGYSVSTVRRIRAVLSQALTQGERWGLLVRNVAAVTRGPRQTRQEGRSMSIEEARVLLESLEGHRLAAMYATMLGLGLRRGEALGLKWTDIDFAKRTVSVRRALKRENGTLVLGDVKTSGSRRVLTMPSPVSDGLRAHRARQASERLAAGESWRDSGLVFTTQIGSPLDPRNIYRDFVTVAQRAGIGRWHPHELRHSAASIMLAQGVPIEVVSNVLGHSSIRMTADVYGHIQQSQRDAAADAMTAAIWSKPK